MSDLSAAIIGYGLAGRWFHAPLIAATPGLRVASIVTGNPERQAQAAREHPDAQVLATPAQLWEGPAPDLVVNAAPNHAHAPLARQAIDHGVPVVVDKPLGVTAAEAEALIAHAEDAGVLLTVFHNRRWDSDFLTLSRLMAEGRLGNVIRYESRFERWRPEANAAAWRESSPPEQGGGLLLDLGTHLVDQALALFGEVEHIHAEVDSRRGLPGDDDTFLALRHAGGVISHLHASALTAAPGPRLRVLGMSGAFVSAELDSQEAALRAGKRPDRTTDWGVEPEARWGRLVRGDEQVPVRSERGDWPQFYARLATALREGGPPPVQPRDALAGLRVLEQARTAAAAR